MSFGAFMSSIDAFARPALAGAGQAMGTLGKVIGPAIGEAGKAVGKFGKETALPAIGEIGKALGSFGKDKLAPAMGFAMAGAASSLDSLSKEQIREFADQARTALGPAGNRLETLPEEVLVWIKAHPIQTAAFLASSVTLVAPGLVSAPVLYALGWGGAGVRAGTAAAALQASAGNVAARGVFATLQSAAMGGYGSAAVHAAIRGSSLVMGGMGAAAKDRTVNQKPKVEEEKVKEITMFDYEVCHEIEQKKLHAKL